MKPEMKIAWIITIPLSFAFLAACGLRDNNSNNYSLPVEEKKTSQIEDLLKKPEIKYSCKFTVRAEREGDGANNHASFIFSSHNSNTLQDRATYPNEQSVYIEKPGHPEKKYAASVSMKWASDKNDYNIVVAFRSPETSELLISAYDFDKVDEAPKRIYLEGSKADGLLINCEKEKK